MTLAEQFPDASIMLRTKFRMDVKNRRRHIGSEQLAIEDKVMAKFYQDEYKKWHIKLVVIVVACLASFYFVVANLPGFFKWILS
jgi:hypothetical protein